MSLPNLAYDIHRQAVDLCSRPFQTHGQWPRDGHSIVFELRLSCGELGNLAKMKGKVLGVGSDAEPGVIVGEDGNRYRYSATDWKGEALPAVGAEVDFDVGADGAAKDIYPPLTNRGLNISLEKASLPPAKDMLAIAKSTPIIWAAAAALLASVFLTFVNVSLGVPGLDSLTEAGPFARNLTGDSTLLGLGGKIDSARKLIGFIARMAAAAEADVATLSLLKKIGGFIGAFYLVYLTPILAAATIYFEIVGKSSKRLNISFGISCCLSVGLIWIAQSQITNAMTQIGDSEINVADIISASDIISLGFGAWVILLSGLAAFAITFNLIKLKTT